MGDRWKPGDADHCSVKWSAPVLEVLQQHKPEAARFYSRANWVGPKGADPGLVFGRIKRKSSANQEQSFLVILFKV